MVPAPSHCWVQLNFSAVTTLLLEPFSSFSAPPPGDMGRRDRFVFDFSFLPKSPFLVQLLAQIVVGR